MTHPYRDPQLLTTQKDQYVCPCGVEHCAYEPLHSQEAAWEAEQEEKNATATGRRLTREAATHHLGYVLHDADR